MIHSSFDAMAQFLHRKTELARNHTLDWIGPRLGPVVFSLLMLMIFALAGFLLFVLADTMFDLGYIQWTRNIQVIKD